MFLYPSICLSTTDTTISRRLKWPPRYTITYEQLPSLSWVLTPPSPSRSLTSLSAVREMMDRRKAVERRETFLLRVFLFSREYWRFPESLTKETGSLKFFSVLFFLLLLFYYTYSLSCIWNSARSSAFPPTALRGESRVRTFVL